MVKNKHEYITAGVLILLSSVILVWLAIFLAPIFDSRGLSYTFQNWEAAKQNPLELRWCSNTPKFILIALLIELISAGYVFVSHKNTRTGEEQGSAKLVPPDVINKHLSDPDPWKNRILTQNTAISITGRKAPVSLNTLVVGGMGSGKSFFINGPNILQANTSFVGTDPSKELVEEYGWFLKEKAGYEVKVLDCIDLEKSTRYNFFKYLRDEDDMRRIADMIFKATVDKEKRGGSNADPMWELMAQDYLLSLIALIYYRGLPSEQNIATIIWLMNEDFLLDENGKRVETCVMQMFDMLEEQLPGNLATMAYRSATDGDVVTIRGVKSTLRGRIGKFLLPSVQSMMEVDEMELDMVGKKKTALFLCVPSEDSSFNFIVSLLYCQLFPILYRQARNSPGRHLEIPIQFLMDEMTNFALPDEYIQNLTTGRKHWMSYLMFIQELGQLKKQFKDEDQTLIGTCNTVIYLGGSGKNTNKYFSEWIGDTTIVSKSHNVSRGSRGSYSENESPTKRALFTPDELDTKLQDDECFLYTKGKGFCLDKKYNPLKHPNYKYAASGGEGKVLDYGGDNLKLMSSSQAVTTRDKVTMPDITLDLNSIDLDLMAKALNIKIYE